jgi:uncharacterized protein YbjT (DUF2867 family)
VPAAPLHVVVFGPTGTAGSAAVGVALGDARVARVTAVTRRPLALEHPRLRTVLCSDFLDLSPHAEALAGAGACLYCLGVAQSQVRDPQRYAEITRDYALAAARALCLHSPEHRFHFLSGQGADPSGRSRVRFARVKGETEVALAGLGLARLHVWRPGYIHPVGGGNVPHLGYRLTGWLYPLLRLSRALVVSNVELARAMLQAVVHDLPPAIRENRDIRALADAYERADG